jgi:hypothetical protein
MKSQNLSLKILSTLKRPKRVKSHQLALTCLITHFASAVLRIIACFWKINKYISVKETASGK